MTAVPPRWTPTPEQVEATELFRFQTERGYADYESLRRWSVDHPDEFWRAVWDRFGVVADGDPTTVLADASMPGAVWFPDVALSYPEHVFLGKDDEAVALQHASELRPSHGGVESWTWGRLRRETARIRAGLQALGVTRGDRVAAYLPNIPEALAAMLATTSLGAIWSSCSPDFGSSTVLDRFDQIEPTVLLAVDGYRYGGKDFDRRAVVAELGAGLPTVARTVVLGYLDPSAGDWDEAFPPLDGPVTLEFERVPFDHPLWILYSSGTSGKPKAIVHGHGGILLESLKTAYFHLDARPDDRVFWFTTTGWMMWNFLVSVLLTEAQVVLYDGNPTGPDPAVLWDLAERTGITVFGTSAAYLHAQLKLGVEPTDGRDLSAIRAVGSTGSPLSVAGFEWVYDHLGSDVWLFSISGGTDVCSAFVGGVPTLPVHVGELQARSLGVALEAWGDDGRPVPPAVVGELVVTRPMPSMPVGFWNDPGGTRYREAYFEHFPGVWRHGDWIELTDHGSAIIHGRSDATINRGGIRMGTAEIYAAVLSVDGVTDALVVDVPDSDPAADSWMPLFVVTDRELTEQMVGEIKARVRAECSPRHVPNVVVRVPAVPRTLTGKVLEVPVKKLFLGADPDQVAARDALANPDAFDWFVDYVGTRPAR